MKIYLLSPPKELFLSALPDLFRTGVDWFQYRRPGLSDAERSKELDKIHPIAKEHNVKLIVNNRPDLALVSGADGVHLGADDLPAGTVKKRWPELTVGATVRVENEFPPEVDYYGVGPVFSPESKELNISPCGWAGVKKAIDRTNKPVFAIGGIRPERLEGVPDGLAGIAVIDSVWNSKNPLKELETLRERLESSPDS